MPDARRQIWEIRIPRDVELTPLENRNEQEQNKDDKKKELREMENQRKKRRKRDEWKDNEKWSFMKWSLVKITLKHNLGLFILSFKTMNPGLHYVPEKSILIKHGYSDWRDFSLRIFL